MTYRRLILSILFVLGVLAPAGAGFVRTWLICGPFGPDLETAYIENEKGIKPREGDSSSDRKWSLYSSLTNEVSFEEKQAMGYMDMCSAYAYVEIKSPVERKAKLKVGSDDGIKIWLNGRVILSNDVKRGVVIDNDTLNILLEKGVNRLLIKVNDEYGGWGFVCNITDMEGKDLSDIDFLPRQENLLRLPVREIIYSSIEANDIDRLGPAMMLDGNMSTRWASSFADPQWIIIDHGEKVTLNRMVIVWESAHAKKYRVEASNNGKDWKKIYEENNCPGGKEDIFLDKTSCRYTKLYFEERATPWGNSIFELYMYGSAGRSLASGNELADLSVKRDENIKEILAVKQYPKEIAPGSKIEVAVEWDKAPSSGEYKMVVQLENWDYKPGVCIMEEIADFDKSGSKKVILAIPDDVPTIGGYRIVAAFVSKKKNWDDAFFVTGTKKNITVTEADEK
ncbi:MAG: discoidin domain-containing protein [Elusimicrobia bacterium]|nr:discoidin domain-containing protein [Elusimicrobiota bacterium]